MHVCVTVNLHARLCVCLRACCVWGGTQQLPPCGSQWAPVDQVLLKANWLSLRAGGKRLRQSRPGTRTFCLWLLYSSLLLFVFPLTLSDTFYFWFIPLNKLEFWQHGSNFHNVKAKGRCMSIWTGIHSKEHEKMSLIFKRKSNFQNKIVRLTNWIILCKLYFSVSSIGVLEILNKREKWPISHAST